MKLVAKINLMQDLPTFSSASALLVSRLELEMLQYQATTLLSLIPKATFLADFQTILMNLRTLSLSVCKVGAAHILPTLAGRVS
jgi:hypothetical protein